MNTCIICCDEAPTDSFSCQQQHAICNGCLNDWVSKHLVNREHASQINSDGTIKCPMTDGCDSTISLSQLVSHCRRETVDKILVTLLELGNRQAAATKVTDSPSLSKRELSVEDHVNNIQALLNKQCPHCSRVYVDFDACIAVCCDGEFGCGNYFCGACFELIERTEETEASQLAHAHALKRHGEMFLSPQRVEMLNRRFFRGRFWDYVNKIDLERTRNELIVKSRPTVVDVLGSDFELAKNRIAPDYGISSYVAPKKSRRAAIPPAQWEQPPANWFQPRRAAIPPAQWENWFQPVVPPPVNMPPPLINLDEEDGLDPQELAQLNHFRDNGVYDLYLTLFRELHLDPYPENTPVNLERVRHILEQLELVNDYLREIGSFQQHLAQRLAHKLKEQFRIRVQFLNFLNGDFAGDIIKKFQEEALIQLGRERLALTLLDPEEFGRLSQQQRRERSETVRRVKKVLFNLDREEVIGQVTALVNDEDWIE